jgi:hypothetical protein
MVNVTLKFGWAGTDEELNEILRPLVEVLEGQEKQALDIDVSVPLVITPDYASINAFKSIVGPWIDCYGGDEWYDVMSPLHQAIHTDYGLDDDDLARICRILWKNIDSMHEWMESEGHDYGLSSLEEEAEAAERARGAREYWLNGGNLTNSDHAKSTAKATIDSLPRWLFGE